MPIKLAELPNLWALSDDAPPAAESSKYLSDQLITYIGNKRSLLPLIQEAMAHVQDRTGRSRLRILDAFAGSGVVSRFFKQYAEYLVSNDLERYAGVIGRCYLANIASISINDLRGAHQQLLSRINKVDFEEGFIRRLYSPRDERNIQPGERVFYTVRNATLLDDFRRLIDRLPAEQQPFFLAPLLSEASIHANTSGVFKGFYKNSTTGVGQFGGNGRNALTRIMGEITLPFPVFSRFETECEVCQEDANQLVRRLKNLDVAYFDPPYNQHPYGSNYFMLNLLVDYREPQAVSEVSGIPDDWNRSAYNKRKLVLDSLRDLFDHTDARFILLSYNDEGFVSREQIIQVMTSFGDVRTFERQYNTFRGSRNLRDRPIHVTEHLFLVERR